MCVRVCRMCALVIKCQRPGVASSVWISKVGADDDDDGGCEDVD